MREKIYRSLNTSDLTQEEWESAAHVVASMGAAQIGNRKHLSIGAMLLRIKGGNAIFLPRVKALLTLTIVSKARKDRWHGVSRDRASTLVEIALDHFLDPNCAKCHGVGRIGEPGQIIILCSRKDGGCGGTGKRQTKWSGWMERAKDVLALLDRYESYASAGTRRQARGI
jgi:hypothetical protein